MDLNRLKELAGIQVLKENVIHLNKNDVPDFLRMDYTGSKFKLESTTNVTIPITAGMWDSGSRDVYFAVELDKKLIKEIKVDKNTIVNLSMNHAIIRRSIFQGKDIGIVIYIHPDNVSKLLPNTNNNVELSDNDKKILSIHKGIKSNYRLDIANRHGISAQEYENSKQKLISLKLLNNNGAITTYGKNMVETFPSNIKKIY